MITVTVDTSEVDDLLAAVPGALARAQQTALKAIGTYVSSDATRAFRDASLRPSPWAPRKDGKATHPLLIKSGSLRQSVRHRLEGADTVVVGSDKEYARYHQEGTKHMPARPFFPVDEHGQIMPTVMQQITHKVQEAYAAEIRKVFGNGGG